MTPTEVDEAPYTLAEPDHPGTHSELGATVRALLRSWWIILLCGVIALAAGVAVSNRGMKTYVATAYVLINTNNFQQAVSGGSSVSSPLTQQATAIATLTPVRQENAAAAAGVGPNESYGISVTAGSNSEVLDVQASTRNPRTAAALADAAAHQMIDSVKQTNASTLRDARAVVLSQLRAASKKNKLPLAGELNSFQTLEALDNQSLQIIQRALVPAVPSGISKARTGGIALVLGLILGVAIALLRRPRAERA